MGNDRWAKFRALCKDIERHITDNPPRLVVPKRSSGPRLIPSDWYEYDKQASIAPQCALCHQRPLPSEAPLIKGLCGPCRSRLAESPEAA